MRPDLADPAQRAAYKKELRRIAPVPRMLGFVLIVLGVAGLFYTQFRAPWEQDLRLASWLLIAAGWVVWIFVIVTRTRHHRRRMAGN
jgi:hypothetical protein